MGWSTFRMPGITERDPRRPAGAHVVIDLGDGKTMHMQFRHPMIEVAHERDYEVGMYSFGDPLMSYRGPSQVTLTLTGYLDDPQPVGPALRAQPKPQPVRPPEPPPAEPVDGTEWMGAAPTQLTDVLLPDDQPEWTAAA